MPTLLDGDEKFKVHIYMWHGFSSELYMTIGVVALGVLAYLTLSKWRKVYGLFPEKLTLNKLYDVVQFVERQFFREEAVDLPPF